MSAYVLDNGQRVYPAFLLNDESGGGIVTPPASFRLADGTQVQAVVLVDEAGEIAAHPAATGMSAFDSTGYEPLNSAFFSANAALTDNTVYMTKFRLPVPKTITGISVLYGTGGGGNHRVGIASFDGTNHPVVASSASTASAPGLVTTNFTASFDASADTDYWALFAVDNTTATLRRVLSNASINGLGSKGLSKASWLPSMGTITGATGDSAMVWMRLHFA